MRLFRHADRRWGFGWESAAQPAARWHADGEGPVQYLADTPDGAWAEFLRHEEIRDADDLAGVSRALWVVDAQELDDAERPARPRLPRATMTGGLDSHPFCQAEARRIRRRGRRALVAPSAALLDGTAAGWQMRDGLVHVLFGPRPNATGWRVVEDGRPPTEVLARVRHLR